MSENNDEIVIRKATTRKMRCSCYHIFQDRKYGKGYRLHNLKAKDSGWRCTVCGSSK